MQELISVIVPIYNVEKYVKKCIESICGQSYTNLEIILVDDGSTDSSGLICDEYAEKDSRIEVLHQKNAGISAARNHGLDIARGQYIAFVDSDDYVGEQIYERLLSELQKEKADIAICNFEKVDVEGALIGHTSQIQAEVLSGDDVLHKTQSRYFWHHVVVWNKLYRSYIFDNVRFAVGKSNEDVFIVYDIFKNAKKITQIQDALYYYRARENSEMTAGSKLRHLDAVEGAYISYKKCELENRELMPYMYYLARHTYKKIIEITYMTKDNKRRKKEIKRMFRYMFIHTKGNKGLKNMVEAFWPEFYFTIRKMLGIG